MQTEVNYCKCGSYDEWETSNSKGVPMEPDINWNGHYRCMNCNDVKQLVEDDVEIKEYGAVYPYLT